MAGQSFWRELWIILWVKINFNSISFMRKPFLLSFLNVLRDFQFVWMSVRSFWNLKLFLLVFPRIFLILKTSFVVDNVARTHSEEFQKSYSFILVNIIEMKILPRSFNVFTTAANWFKDFLELMPQCNVPEDGLGPTLIC